MKAKELVKILNEKKLIQEAYPEDCKNLYKLVEDYGLKLIEENLDVDKHGWYETSISVYEYDNGIEKEYIGIRMVTDLFSESMSYSNCYWSYGFVEMEKIVTHTFKPVKN